MGFTKSNIVHTKNSTRFKGELYGVLIIGLAGSKMSAHRFFFLFRDSKILSEIPVKCIVNSIFITKIVF